MADIVVNAVGDNAAAANTPMVIDLADYDCYVIKRHHYSTKTYIKEVVKIKKSTDIDAYDSICIILDKDSMPLRLSIMCMDENNDVLKYGERVLNVVHNQRVWWAQRVLTRDVDLANDKMPTCDWKVLDATLDKGHPFKNVSVLEIFRHRGWS